MIAGAVGWTGGVFLGAGLRELPASVVVGARARIVQGAVGRVQLALQRLKEEGVELDEERKAAMVSNLLVLCSEQATRKVSQNLAGTG